MCYCLQAIYGRVSIAVVVEVDDVGDDDVVVLSSKADAIRDAKMNLGRHERDTVM